MSIYIAGQIDYVGTKIQSTNWTHHAITTTSTQLKFYINGVPEYSTSTFSFSGDTNYNYFGSFSSGNTDNYKGYIDDMRLYPSALSAAQITQIYNGA